VSSALLIVCLVLLIEVVLGSYSNRVERAQGRARLESALRLCEMKRGHRRIWNTEMAYYSPVSVKRVVGDRSLGGLLGPRAKAACLYLGEPRSGWPHVGLWICPCREHGEQFP
jgi:hypothetical protein